MKYILLLLDPNKQTKLYIATTFDLELKNGNFVTLHASVVQYITSSINRSPIDTYSEQIIKNS